MESQHGDTQTVPGGTVAGCGAGLGCGTTTVSRGGGFGLLLLKERQPASASGNNKAMRLSRCMTISRIG
jgi:hypothetical protein